RPRRGAARALPPAGAERDHPPLKARFRGRAKWAPESRPRSRSVGGPDGDTHRTTQDTRENTAMPYLELPEHALYYEVDGSGPPLLMVMGLGGNAQVWAPIRRRLTRHWRLVMYDMQGTGRTGAPGAVTTIDDLVGEIEALR